MDYKNTPYFNIGRASDLSGVDRRIYRALEIMPGVITWFTLFAIFGISFMSPFLGALFIIIFDLYWLLKTVYLSIYLYKNWKRTKHNITVDWKSKLSNLRYEKIMHMIILPFYNESLHVVEKGLESILECDYDNSQIIIVLASEAKAGKIAEDVAQEAKKKFGDKFGYFLITKHPANVPGELAGKGSNIAYAAKTTKEEILDINNIDYSDVIVSAFDIDTVVYPQYLNCLTWHFLTAEDPYRSSFQPVPFYNNNIWDTPALSRVSGASSTLWQMIQQERPDKLETFSSHSVSFKTLHDIGYWQKNIVSEDSRIFWNAFLAFDGKYTVVPMSYPVSMDANLAHGFWPTILNVYKQQRRWAWGVENLPYVLFGFLKNKKIPKIKKLVFSFLMVEGAWTRSTSSILILLLGWTPLILGGKHFNETVLSYNLPLVTSNLMTLTMIGLILSATVSFGFLPPHPQGFGIKQKLIYVLQWFLIPIIVIVFGNVPAIDAQTRLMFGKYMGFWVTPKHRKIK